MDDKDEDRVVGDDEAASEGNHWSCTLRRRMLMLVMMNYTLLITGVNKTNLCHKKQDCDKSLTQSSDLNITYIHTL